MTTVHVAAGARVSAHVPAVPGYVPPVNENGAVNAAADMAVEGTPPVFVIVKLKFVEDPRACEPKSRANALEIDKVAGD